MEREESPTTRRRILQILAVLALLGGLAWALAGGKLHGITDSFSGVSWNWILAAIGFNVVSALAAALAWWVVVQEAVPKPHPAFKDVLSAFSIGLFANIVLPGRAGEVIRIGVLARKAPKHQRWWPRLAGSVIALRLLDLIPALIVALIVISILPVPHWAVVGTIVIAVVGVALYALAVKFAHRHDIDVDHAEDLSRWRQLLHLARRGLAVFHSPQAIATSASYQCLAWLGQLLGVWATLLAFDIDIGLAGAAFVLMLVNIAILFPFWPGNIGLLQAAVAVPLVAQYDVKLDHAIAFAFGLQATESVVGIGLGLFFLGREGLSLATLRRVPLTAITDEEEAKKQPRS